LQRSVCCFKCREENHQRKLLSAFNGQFLRQRHFPIERHRSGRLYAARRQEMKEEQKLKSTKLQSRKTDQWKDRWKFQWYRNPSEMMKLINELLKRDLSLWEGWWRETSNFFGSTDFVDLASIHWMFISYFAFLNVEFPFPPSGHVSGTIRHYCVRVFLGVTKFEISSFYWTQSFQGAGHICLKFCQSAHRNYVR